MIKARNLCKRGQAKRPSSLVEIETAGFLSLVSAGISAKKEERIELVPSRAIEHYRDFIASRPPSSGHERIHKALRLGYLLFCKPGSVSLADEPCLANHVSWCHSDAAKLIHGDLEVSHRLSTIPSRRSRFPISIGSGYQASVKARPGSQAERCAAMVFRGGSVLRSTSTVRGQCRRLIEKPEEKRLGSVRSNYRTDFRVVPPNDDKRDISN
jgi:hypothetical protein